MQNLPYGIDDNTVHRSAETFRIKTPFPVIVDLGMPDRSRRQERGLALEYVPGPWGAVSVAIPWEGQADGVLIQWYDVDQVKTIRQEE